MVQIKGSVKVFGHAARTDLHCWGFGQVFCGLGSAYGDAGILYVLHVFLPLHAAAAVWRQMAAGKKQCVAMVEGPGIGFL